MKGPALMLAGIGLFTLLDANSKLLSGSYPMSQVVGMRYAVVLLGVLLVWPFLRGKPLLRPENWKPHLIRSLAAMAASAGFFFAFRRLPLAEGYLVFFLAPFATLAMNAIWLRERTPLAAWGWSALGFAGVAFAMLPNLGAGGALEGYFFALVGALGHAVMLTVNRTLRHEGGVLRLLLFPAAMGVVVIGPFGLAEWQPADAVDFLRLALNGLIFGGATTCIAVAFRHAGAARLVPFEFSALIWSVLLDAAVWAVWPAWTTVAGGITVVVACLMSERAAHRPQRPQGKPGGKTWAPAASSGSGTAERTAASGSGP